MNSTATSLPESLGYLPAAFRAEIEPRGVVEHHFVRWLCQAFDSNLHLVERIVQNSGMLFDPDGVALFQKRVASPRLSPSDFVDVRAFARRLKEKGQHHEKVSEMLLGSIPDATLNRLLASPTLTEQPDEAQLSFLADLNRVIEGPSIYDEQNFSEVKLSPLTRRLLKSNPEGDAVQLLNRLLLRDAYPLDIIARPQSSLFEMDDWEWRHLQWLGRWVALDLDQEWLTEEAERSSATPNAGALTRQSVHRHARVRKIIKQIAALYRLRGTAAGLRQTIKLLYDLDVEIVERSWPQGMQIGFSSCIGLDAFLMESTRPDRQFIVLIKSTEHNRRLLHLSGEWIQSRVVGKFNQVRIQSVLKAPLETSSLTPDEARHAEERRASTVSKLRLLIDSEKPAHTEYYLAVEVASPSAVARTIVPPLIIETKSVIGRFFLN